MDEFFILIRGKVRDFDDIYENPPLEPIAEARTLMSLIESKFGLLGWTKIPKEKNRWEGKSENSDICVGFDVVNDGAVNILTIASSEKSKIIEFAQENSLNILQKGQ